METKSEARNCWSEFCLVEESRLLLLLLQLFPSRSRSRSSKSFRSKSSNPRMINRLLTQNPTKRQRMLHESK